MRRKEVSRRLESVAEARSSLHAHREPVGKRWEERPAAQSAGALSQPYFDHMDGELASVESDLIAAEDRHTRKLVRIAKLRRESSELTAGVYDKQAAARQILVGLYGSDSDYELAAASGQTPRVPRTLGEQVDQTVKLLRDPECTKRPERIKGVKLVFGTMAEDLEDGLGQLSGTRVDLQRTTKEADATRVLVNAAIKEYDRVFPWVASNLESTFRLAGEHELADRIRTSRRRVTRRLAGGGGDSEGQEATEESQDDSTGDSTGEAPPAQLSESPLPESPESPQAAPATADS